MSDQIIVTQEPESSETSNYTENQDAVVSAVRSRALILCASGLGISFFLPWAVFLGGMPSGFDLQKMGDQHLLLWLIPLFSIFTILATVTKRSETFMAQLTGLLPFAVGFYWFTKLGSDMQHILRYGAYLSLSFGAALFVIPRLIK